MRDLSEPQSLIAFSGLESVVFCQSATYGVKEAPKGIKCAGVPARGDITQTRPVDAKGVRAGWINITGVQLNVYHLFMWVSMVRQFLPSSKNSLVPTRRISIYAKLSK